MGKGNLVMAAGAALTLALAAPAEARAAWSEPSNLSAPGAVRFDTDRPDIERAGFRDVDSDQSPNGRAIAVWRYTPPSGSRNARLFVSVASPTSAFGRPQSIGMSPVGRAFFRGAIADDGQGLIVFQEVVRARPRIYRRIRAVRVLESGAIGPITTLSAPRVDSLTPRVTELPDGRFAVAWRTRKGVVQVTKVQSGRSEGPVRTVTRDALSGLALASAGEDVAVTYVDSSDSHDARIVLWPRGGLPSASQSLGAGSVFVAPTVRGAGSAFVVGTLIPNMSDGPGSARVQRFSPTGPLEPVTSTRDQLVLEELAVAIGAGGHAVLLYARGGGDREIMILSANGLSSPFGAQERLAGSVDISAEAVAVNARGDTLVVYEETKASPNPGELGQDELLATLRPVGGAFSAPVNFGGGQRETQSVVLRDDGSALALFLRPAGSRFAVATATYTP